MRRTREDSLSLSPLRKEEKSERQAMPQQKTIIVPLEGNVNFCAVGQCYRRRAWSAARQNFVRFYMRIGWSSTRSFSLPAPALSNCHLPRVARCAFTWAGRENPSLLPRTHLHLEKPTEFLFRLDGTDPKTKRLLSCQLSGTKSRRRRLAGEKTNSLRRRKKGKKSRR